MNAIGVLAIAGMAVGTYLTRIGGYWLVSRFELTSRARAWLEYVPAAVLASLVVPELTTGGPEKLVAGMGVLFVSYRWGNILYSMLAGIGLVLVFRQLPFG